MAKAKLVRFAPLRVSEGERAEVQTAVRRRRRRTKIPFETMRPQTDIEATMRQSAAAAVGYVQGRAQKTLLSSVAHVPSGLIGCASATLGWWEGGRREIQTCKYFFAPRCTR